MEISREQLSEYYDMYEDTLYDFFLDDHDDSYRDEVLSDISYYNDGDMSVFVGAITFYGFSDEWGKFCMRSFKKRQKEKKKSQGYQYIVTFTLKEDISKDEIFAIEKYIKKQFLRAPLKIRRADIVQEQTEQGRPHWHVAVHTDKWLKKDRFDYYIKKYGFVDISRSKSTNYNHRLEYINKSNTSEQIV